MPRNKRRLLKRRNDRDQLVEILSRPLSVEHYRRQLAWVRRERCQYGRIHFNDDDYIAYLEQGAGVALEDAQDSWLTSSAERE